MEGLNKSLIHALKTRKKTLTKGQQRNEEKSPVFRSRLKTVILCALTTDTGVFGLSQIMNIFGAKAKMNEHSNSA